MGRMKEILYRQSGEAEYEESDQVAERAGAWAEGRDDDGHEKRDAADVSVLKQGA
jgi:hypothetical protein